MNPNSVTLPIAFLAGLLSFLSPCVLPLVPAYVSYLGGSAVLSDEAAQARHAMARGFLHALLFVLGFAAVFVLFGASATLLGRLLLNYRPLLQRVGGVILVVFGLRLMAVGWGRRQWLLAAAVTGILTFGFGSGFLTQGHAEWGQEMLARLAEGLMMMLAVLAGANVGSAMRAGLALGAGVLNLFARLAQGLPDPAGLVPIAIESLLICGVAVVSSRAEFFYSEKRLEVRQGREAGLARSFVFGVVFAAGWTPCLGPILAAILVLASQLQTVGQGVLLLIVYSLGLGIPFLLVGLAFGPLSPWLRRANRYLGVVSAVSGVLLVLMGILVFTDSLSLLARYGNFINLGL